MRFIPWSVAAGGGPPPAWAKGFNFRATSGYVTDGSYETYVLADAYPTTRNGVTFGWEGIVAGSSRDRNSALDRRLAGVNYYSSGTAPSFRVDLPATGNYIVSLALGDATTANYEGGYIKDDTTVLSTIATTQPGTSTFKDASGTVRTTAAWPGSNVPVTLTFATQIFRFTLGTRPTGANVIAHLFLQQ